MANWIIEYLKENSSKLDDTDVEIIKALLDNSRTSTQQIANLANIKRTTAHERIKKLEEREIITGYTAKLNYKNCGLPLRVFMLVTYDAINAGDLTQKDIAKKISSLPYVIQVDIITGPSDFIVELQVDFMENLGEVIMESMRQIPGVGNTQTLLSFKNFIGGLDSSKIRG
ncbi:MAG: Lrp/AsnC family transcriptional regulator [Candidatus Heimdallarchaeota archaeon]|nr:Lrp/AsnC family transcriptional regulator [Candidatus Heimdallarchaeota archaeon]